MISSLRGTICKHDIPFVTVDVHGVGYSVQCTMGLWERMEEGSETYIHIYTLVRENRLELFGFSSTNERVLFLKFLSIPGVGPRTAINLASVPAGILAHAAENSDTRALGNLKGIGKKMAEKLLVELQSFVEKGILIADAGDQGTSFAEVDADALEALTNLGYDRRSILKELRNVPNDAETTEDRVKCVLQAL